MAKEQFTPIYPLHPSTRAQLAKGYRIRPRNMAVMDIGPEQAAGHSVTQKIAIEIYTDMVNAGASLQETVAAIYLSGLVHGAKLSEGLNDGTRQAETTSTKEANKSRSHASRRNAS
jgi:hypothetical protein